MLRCTFLHEDSSVHEVHSLLLDGDLYSSMFLVQWIQPEILVQQQIFHAQSQEPCRSFQKEKSGSYKMYSNLETTLYISINSWENLWSQKKNLYKNIYYIHIHLYYTYILYVLWITAVSARLGNMFYEKCYLMFYRFKTFGAHTHFIIRVELPHFLKGFKGDIYRVLITVYS